MFHLKLVLIPSNGTFLKSLLSTKPVIKWQLLRHRSLAALFNFFLCRTLGPKTNTACVSCLLGAIRSHLTLTFSLSLSLSHSISLSHSLSLWSILSLAVSQFLVHRRNQSSFPANPKWSSVVACGGGDKAEAEASGSIGRDLLGFL